ncbi:MAG: hypothetical protein PHN88_14755 [Ignavibacteria bacterium]|nr:hypothetical protein [Ignavibacteria bacterium]
MTNLKQIILAILAGFGSILAASNDPELDLLQASLDKVRADSAAEVHRADSIAAYYATPDPTDTATVEETIREVTVLSPLVDSLQAIINGIKPTKQNALKINLLKQEQIVAIIGDYHGQQRMVLTANLKKLQKEEQKIKYGKR